MDDPPQELDAPENEVQAVKPSAVVPSFDDASPQGECIRAVGSVWGTDPPHGVTGSRVADAAEAHTGALQPADGGSGTLVRISELDGALAEASLYIARRKVNLGRSQVTGQASPKLMLFEAVQTIPRCLGLCHR